MNVSDLTFGPNGLLPVVVLHEASGEVRMLGYANQEALERTLATGEAWFYSRSRQELWHKGETSGNVLEVTGLRVDCDADAVIYLCLPAGPTCHTGAQSCFFDTLGEFPHGETDGEAAGELWDTIQQRAHSGDASSSYVARLLAQGIDRVAQKVGEEGVEVVIAAKNEDPEALVGEIADLWFHSYVLLAKRGLTPSDVWEELRSRRK